MILETIINFLLTILSLSHAMTKPITSTIAIAIATTVTSQPQQQGWTRERTDKGKDDDENKYSPSLQG